MEVAAVEMETIWTDANVEDQGNEERKFAEIV